MSRYGIGMVGPRGKAVDRLGRQRDWLPRLQQRAGLRYSHRIGRADRGTWMLAGHAAAL